MKRRSFISTSVAAGLASTALGPVFDPFTARAYGRLNPLARLAAAAGTGRVLVVVQLDGGNDGINTVVPHADPLYAQLRGGLAITDSLRINDTLGWNPGMTGVRGMYDAGRVAVVQNVGYPNPNRSHFRATDIWFTASNNTNPPDANTLLYDGWLGRYLDQRYPGYPDTTPAHPMALQIGSTTALLLQGPKYPMGMSVSDPEQFYRIIAGTDISGSEKPDLSTPAGLELDYIQRIAAEAISYAKPVRDIFNAMPNKVTYASGTVANQLKIVARLIGGGLDTPIYIISQRGYDTHADQKPRHQSLLGDLSAGITSFFDDLAAMGVADRVLLMTVSEFGRRAQANNLGSGKEGTDHGTALPVIFAGPTLKPGVYGNNPDLGNLKNGDIVHQFDFKQLYASVLTQWFGAKPAETSLVLKGDFSPLDLFPAPPVGTQSPDTAGFMLEQNFPNPVSLSAAPVTNIGYRTAGGRTSLRVYDMQGKLAATVLDTDVAPGRHEARFDTRALSAGTYVYRLESRGLVETRMLVVSR